MEMLATQAWTCSGDAPCTPESGTLAMETDGDPDPLALGVCDRAHLVLCARDPDATPESWAARGAPMIALDPRHPGIPWAAPADPSSFLTIPLYSDAIRYCETDPSQVQALCGPGVGAVDGAFACGFDIDPNCAEVREGRYSLALQLKSYIGSDLESNPTWKSLLPVLDLRIGTPCTKDADCHDANPCNAESCVEGVCRFPDTPAVTDCCWAPADHDPRDGKAWAGFERDNYLDRQCDDDDPCTTDSCSQPSCSHTPVTGCVP